MIALSWQRDISIVQSKTNAERSVEEIACLTRVLKFLESIAQIFPTFFLIDLRHSPV